jgi:hypothetical protein
MEFGWSRTCIPIHNLIRQLPIAFLRPQFLAFFQAQWVLGALLRRTKCALEAGDRGLASGYYAFVIGFEEYAHGVYHGGRAFEMLCVG